MFLINSSTQEGGGANTRWKTNDFTSKSNQCSEAKKENLILELKYLVFIAINIGYPHSMLGVPREEETSLTTMK